MVQKFTIVPIAIFICKKIIMAERNLVFESKIYKQKKLTLTTFDNHCNNNKGTFTLNLSFVANGFTMWIQNKHF